MDDLIAARGQMAMSLAFHILFACAGIAMPLLMVLAERRHQKTGDPLDLELAKRWAKGTAILFAVGAVSGTVLSFELGLLFPEFMRFAGPIVGMPFSLEGFAFFFEAIGLGFYLYGWQRLSPRLHLASGVLVLVMGVLSGLFVVSANAWMNTPTGFTLDLAGKVVDVDPLAAMLNPAAFTQCLHMTLAAFVAVGFAVAGIHAFRLRRHPGSELDRRALGLALWVGGVAAVLQPISGDLSAKHVAEHQPVKLAAMEAHFESERCAPLRIGGIPDETERVTRFAIEIPCAFSFLAYGDFDAEVKGLSSFPEELWPPVGVTHLGFQVMILAGFTLAGTALLAVFLAWRRRALPTGRRFLLLLMLVSPLGLLAVEAGWVVTEVGRQPWVVYGVLKTADAVTPMPGLWAPFLAFTLLYLVLGVTAVVLLRRHVFLAPTGPGAAGAATHEEAA
jgi:cytochrome d ubiquinol oxidase subunit I